jgi:hypothetical protein
MKEAISQNLDRVSNAQEQPKKLYDDAIQAQLQALQTDTELLFQQLQNLSRQRLTQSGVAQ